MKVDSILTLHKSELSSREWERLFRTLSFVDKEGIEVAAFDYVPGSGTVRIARGAWSLIPEHVSVTDLRSRPKMPKVSYAKTLDAKDYEGQEEAIRVMFKHEQGQVIAPPGRGKTEIGLAFAAASGTRTLVVVHTKDLFKQWEDRARGSVPNVGVGKIKAGTCQVEHITIAMAQTLKKYVGRRGKFWRQFGCVIVDESHHAAADTWEWLLNECPAYYRFGLTATEKRADGRHPLVKFNIGPTIYNIPFKSQVPLMVRPVGTRHRARYGPMMYSRMLKDITNDAERNLLIAKIAAEETREGNTVLILSRHIKHLELIGSDILGLGIAPEDVSILTGKVPMTLRNTRVKDFRSGDIRVVLATQLADEGLDVPRLNRVLLTFPGKHDGRIIQQIGRAIRKHSDKTDAIVYDFVDEFVPKFTEQYLERKSTYRKLGIHIGKAVQHGSIYEQKGKARKSGADFIRSLKVRRDRGS